MGSIEAWLLRLFRRRTQTCGDAGAGAPPPRSAPAMGAATDQRAPGVAADRPDAPQRLGDPVSVAGRRLAAPACYVLRLRQDWGTSHAFLAAHWPDEPAFRHPPPCRDRRLILHRDGLR